MNALGLSDGWVFSDEEHRGDDTWISATYTYRSPPTVCPKCGAVDPGFSRYGTETHRVRDLPRNTRRVALVVTRQRYKCLACGGTHFRELPDMDSRRLMTKRLIAYVQQVSLYEVFLDVARELGLAPATVRGLFAERVAVLDAERRQNPPPTPRWLGIDEIHIGKRPGAVFVDLHTSSVMQMLDGDRAQASVERYIRGLKGHRQIEYVTMDMWLPYKRAARAAIPDAKIVVDTYHVVRMATEAMDRARIQLKASVSPAVTKQLRHDLDLWRKRSHHHNDRDRLQMEMWTAEIPLLGQMYTAKEAFHDLWQATDAATFAETYKEWKRKLPREIAPRFGKLTRAITRWNDEVLASFESGLSNASTEAVNGLIKRIQAAGRGYDFATLRAKVIYGIPAQRQRAGTRFGAGLWSPRDDAKAAADEARHRRLERPDHYLPNGDDYALLDQLDDEDRERDARD